MVNEEDILINLRNYDIEASTIQELPRKVFELWAKSRNITYWWGNTIMGDGGDSSIQLRLYPLGSVGEFNDVKNNLREQGVDFHYYQDLKELAEQAIEDAEVYVGTVENDTSTSVYYYVNPAQESVYFLYGILPSLLGYTLSKEEIRLFYALYKRDLEYLCYAASILFKQYSMKKKAEYLNEHKDFGKEQMVRGFENKIKELDYQIRDLYKNIETMTSEKRRIQFNMYSARYLSENDDLTEYLKNRNDIYVYDISQNAVTFQVDTYLDQCDPEVVKTYVSNPSFMSSLTNGQGTLDVESCKKLMNAIFVDRVFKIKGYATFILSTTCVSVANDNCYGLAGYMNPHYHFHACLGENRGVINRCVARGDFVQAVEMSCGAARSINALEVSATFIPFMRLIFNRDNCDRRYLYKDGELYSNTEALAMLAAAEQEANTQEPANINS